MIRIHAPKWSWLRTGDLAYVSELTSRQTVPADLEAVLIRHPEAVGVAVTLISLKHPYKTKLM
jgi:hypothetical protein